MLVKLAPNIFADGFGPAALESAVERSRVNIYGAESTEPLDLLELVWWDLQVRLAGLACWSVFMPCMKSLTPAKHQLSGHVALYGDIVSCWPSYRCSTADVLINLTEQAATWFVT